MGRVNFWERTSINVVTNIIRTLVMSLIGVFLVPYYLDNLGAAAYGIIPLATTMSSYMLIISDALVDSCGRYVTLAVRKHDSAEINETFNTAFWGVLKICIFILPFVLLFSIVSPDIFSVPDGSRHDVQIMFALIFISSLIVSFTSSYDSIFFAHNKLYFLYTSRLAYTVVQVAIIVALFTVSEPSLVDIGVAYLLSSFVLLTALSILSKKIEPCLKLNLRDQNTSLFKKMGVLSAWAIGNKLGSMLYIQISLVLVNIYLGSEIEAGFAIVSSIISMTGTAVISISVAIEPLLYRHYADNQFDEVINVVRISERFLGFMIAMPMAFLIVFSDNIITAWVGSDYIYLYDMIVVSMFANLIHCCTMGMSSVPVLYLKNRMTMLSVTIFGVFNVIFSLFYFQFLDADVLGAMWVWAICFFGQKVMYVLICTKITCARFRDYFIPILQTYLVLILSIGILNVVSDYLDVGTGWLTIIPIFMIFFLVYFVVVFRFIMPRKDRELIQKMVPGFMKKLIKA